MKKKKKKIRKPKERSIDSDLNFEENLHTNI